MDKKNCYLNEITVSYKRKNLFEKQVMRSDDAEVIVRGIYEVDGCEIDLREYFYIVLFSKANHAIGYYRLSEGGLDCTVADARLAFATALKCAASSMLLVHNHPSGNLKPSEEDKLLTKRFEKIAIVLQLKIMDHLILTSEGILSFRDEGLMV